MHALLLTIPALPDGPDALARLLRDWVAHTDLRDAVTDVEVQPGGEEATAVVSRGDRRLELRLIHEEGPRWRLEGASWLTFAGPSAVWTAMVGSVVLFGGLSISLGYLAWSQVAFWVGVAVSALAAVALTVFVRRRARRHRLTDPEHGVHAERLLEMLEPVVRSDRRVAEVDPR